jgi:hypothetical protein
MMVMCMLACLEGRVLPMMDLAKIELASTPIDEINPEQPSPPIFNPEDLIGRTFLMDEQEDGQKFRGCIVELIEDHESKVEDNPTRIQFRVLVNEDKADKIINHQR